ncbi:hypothetical protein BDZ85DRAFT_261265 [Elsinoe ampelina]|uniref:Uncharacterized protein n=1 Tax=Elsinoe ampelina TaxID=302913 RepID=A0A6A6GFX3_9PEZI|nr:hypothetical protein BDZ85DRAFT_261265 [Elsinoe ampelina]
MTLADNTNYLLLCCPGTGPLPTMPFPCLPSLHHCIFALLISSASASCFLVGP